MKESSSTTPESNSQKININQLRDRCRTNEVFFSSFIDMIPSRVYLNPDDRRNWIQIISNDSKKKKSKKEPTGGLPNGATIHHSDDDEDIEMHEEEELDMEYHFNKFDPKYFKTVSQILKDFEVYHQKNKKDIQQKLNSNRIKMLKNNQTSKNTLIKVQNKNQNKSSSKKEKSELNMEENEDNQNEEKVKIDSKKAQKRSSKFKEEKRAAIKRQRLRYDSQSETQIIDIEHSEANSSEKRKPILNKNGEVVFSKFDFTADKTIKTKKKDDKLTPVNAKPKDYKKLLKKLQEKKEKIEELKKVEPEKAAELESKTKWQTAIEKASGVKVKDDISTLKKSVKRMDKKKEKSKKNWEERNKVVEEKKMKVQDKRRKNIEKRKEKKKEKKIKQLKKKGRILPGF
ncbi:surfeit locus 6-like protein [Brachionus plicatilis]|uniref:Surfeit locus 6-like protein n=1 Tax=Brachionus plicatilis TaxID=10195 RepID=A0A3M7STE9_BRAPC|nr:surfeit locus 6-like protein [Brachionus plicatilis]